MNKLQYRTLNFYTKWITRLIVSSTLLVTSAYAQDDTLPLEELRVFSEVFGLIKRDYVEPTDDVDLLRQAITGMLGGLDPHSSYLTPDSFEDIQIGTQGKFGGLGIEVTMEDGLIKVITPIDGTPAARGGVEPGDIIIRLDGTPVKGMSLDDAVTRMRGEVGSEIVLTIVREGRSSTVKITLVRAEIKITSVSSRLLEDNYGYVRITQFQADTGAALRRILAQLKADAENNLGGLILDLRNNPGGVLSGAIAVGDAFLDSGIIVSTRGRNDDSTAEYSATNRDYLDGAAIVVLVNGGSASASEIVAGALQDHKRAIIMGSKTFGKGSVQTILPLKNGAALKITTARYYTPEGRSIQATGIEPDIVSGDLVFTEQTDAKRSSLREANLAGHLENEEVEETPAINQSSSIEDVDPLIREALNLLKALKIVAKAS
jgi:carboxyl-terminal processing protease